MVILICIPCLMTGGTEVQTLNLIRTLVAGGHRVVTACYFEHCDDMVSRFQKAGSEVVCMSPNGVRIGGWRGILFLYKGLRSILKRYKPNVAHVQYMAPGAIPILLLRLLGMRQILTTAHTAADIYPSLTLVHFIQRHCVRAFTCITELAERSFFGSSQLYDEHYPLKKRNHFTIYNALPASLPVIQEPRTANRPVTIGVVSRLESIKGMDLVVPAFAKVKVAHPEVRLLVIGDGTLRGQMEQQAQAAGFSEAAEFVGRQPQEALTHYYDRIDILLMPSRSEGFGLTAIEGMARGCVVVASRVGGLPEVVREGEVGLLHESENIDDLASKLIYLCESPELWCQYSAQAITYVKRFGFDRFSVLFNNLYRRITE
ncbi:glycosyl transferase family 1 [Alistipes sp. An116]|uniref:glycosyltransferase family 4 protein n=1 Tax=Alistipes sp. An116 TaxID=1965546 RepID=UPI000B36FACC|nr:glycosyltransferase family 4 protein [Alistipes sp. An116]OUQ51584.1 glycosyl transferase family 1 [Alistipes sp. An116]